MSYDNYSDEGAICPYCGHLNKADGDSASLFSERTCEWQCEDCEEEFLVDVYVSHSWTTAPTPEAGK